MSTQGIILIDLVCVLLALVLVNLLRQQRLTTGLAVVWLAALTGLAVVVSVPPLLALVTRLVGARYPASALSLVAFVFILAFLIFLSVHVSIVSARQVALLQALASLELSVRELGTPASGTAGPEPR
jgi:hypothetical protein